MFFSFTVLSGKKNPDDEEQVSVLETFTQLGFLLINHQPVTPNAVFHQIILGLMTELVIQTVLNVNLQKVEEFPQKRQKLVNTMIGSVKEGKYSV